MTISATCTCRVRRLVERRGDDLALDRALHVGDLLGPLVDEQHDEVDLGVVGGDAVGDVLQQHRLAGARRRDDQAALPLADRHHQVHDARRQVVGRGLEAGCAPAGRAASGSRRRSSRGRGPAARS